MILTKFEIDKINKTDYSYDSSLHIAITVVISERTQFTAPTGAQLRYVLSGLTMHLARQIIGSKSFI